jgi:hypothetical protein
MPSYGTYVFSYFLKLIYESIVDISAMSDIALPELGDMEEEWLEKN